MLEVKSPCYLTNHIGVVVRGARMNGRINRLWWRHVRWNPKVDGIVLSTTKSKKQHIFGSWWWSVGEVFGVVAIFYANLFVCRQCALCAIIFNNTCYVVVFSLGAFLVVWLCLHECVNGCQLRIWGRWGG